MYIQFKNDVYDCAPDGILNINWGCLTFMSLTTPLFFVTNNASGEVPVVETECEN